MKSVLAFIAREPAMIVTLVLAVINAFVDLGAEQTDAVTTIVESVLLLVGGVTVRQSVTPVAKLPPSRRG